MVFTLKDELINDVDDTIAGLDVDPGDASGLAEVTVFEVDVGTNATLVSTTTSFVSEDTQVVSGFRMKAGTMNDLLGGMTSAHDVVTQDVTEKFK